MVLSGELPKARELFSRMTGVLCNFLQPPRRKPGWATDAVLLHFSGKFSGRARFPNQARFRLHNPGTRSKSFFDSQITIKELSKSFMSPKGQCFYRFGPFQLDASDRVLWKGDRPVSLTPKALHILILLVENRGHVVEKEELLSRVWPDTFVEEGTLTQNVFTLRRQLGSD